MSRVGKSPVAVPSGVTVAITGRTVSVKGKLGELKLDLSDEVDTTDLRARWPVRMRVSISPRGSLIAIS